MNVCQAVSHEDLHDKYARTHIVRMDHLVANIEHLMWKHRVSLAGLAALVKMPQPTLNRIYNGRTEESRRTTLQKLADFAGVTVTALREADLKGFEQSGQTVARSVVSSAKEPETPATATDSFRPLLAWEHEDELPPGDNVLIPRLQIRLSAGGGYEQPELDLVKNRPQIFSADWIRRMRLSPKELRVMYADGDSMEPRIQDGDALVVDLSQTAISDGRVYAMWYPGGERVKRLFVRPNGGLVIHSDNAAYPPMTLSAEEATAVNIIGRIVNTSGHKGL